MAITKFGHSAQGVIYTSSPSNAAEVVSVFAPLELAGQGVWSVESEAGGVLTIRRTFDAGATYETMGSVSSGQWVIRDQVFWLFNPPAGYYNASYVAASQIVTDLAATPQFAAAVGTATARAFVNNASRSLTTSTGAAGFQVSATRDALVGYDVTLSTTATIGGASTSLVQLEIAPTNSATAGDWVEIARLSNSQNITLAVALQSVQGVGGRLTGVVPAGYYAKLRQTNTGTASVTYNTGQEVLL